jgi:hypothetical protein
MLGFKSLASGQTSACDCSLARAVAGSLFRAAGTPRGLGAATKTRPGGFPGASQARLREAAPPGSPSYRDIFGKQTGAPVNGSSTKWGLRGAQRVSCQGDFGSRHQVSGR